MTTRPTPKKLTKKSTKKKTAKSTAKKVVAKKIKAKREKTKPKAKSTSQPKRTTTTQAPTVIKKLIERVNLIVHPITEQHEHPNEFEESYKSVYEISGIGGNTYVKFHRAGIRTVEDFVNAGLNKICKTLGWTERGGLPLFLRALSLHQNRVIKIKPLKTISETPIYLDIETDDLFGSTIWMIGIYISKTKEFIQLVADRRHHEKEIIKKCLEILSDYPGEQIITYSGSRFDERLLRNKFTDHGHNHTHLIFEDILVDLKASLALPIPNYQLGEVGDFFGYRFTHPNMNGLEVASIYSRYSDNLRRYSGYDRLCEYNEDDVKSMFSLVDHLYPKSTNFNIPKSVKKKKFLFESFTEEELKQILDF